MLPLPIVGGGIQNIVCIWNNAGAKYCCIKSVSILLDIQYLILGVGGVEAPYIIAVSSAICTNAYAYANAHDILTRNWYQILVPIFWYHFLVPVSGQYVMGITHTQMQTVCRRSANLMTS